MKFLKEMKVLISILIIVIVLPVIAKGRFEIPTSYKTSNSVLPVSYLESLYIANSSERLKKNEDKMLSCLFFDVAMKSVELYGQTYYIKASSPIITLFMSNHASFKKRRWEGKLDSENGGVIPLSEIAKFIKVNSLCE